MEGKPQGKTTVIALYGGPGTGKTGAASRLYQHLIAAGIEVQQVHEHVKDLAWQGITPTYYDEEWFYGEQSHRQSTLYGRVAVLITDKPLWMHVLYSTKTCPRLGAIMRDLVRAHHDRLAADGHRAVHIFLRRIYPYVSEARYQTEDEAKALDGDIAGILAAEGIPVLYTDGDNIVKLVQHLGLGV